MPTVLFMHKVTGILKKDFNHIEFWCFNKVLSSGTTSTPNLSAHFHLPGLPLPPPPHPSSSLQTISASCFPQSLQSLTCRSHRAVVYLSWPMTNSALVYEPKCWGVQYSCVQNFGDLTPYLTYANMTSIATSPYPSVVLCACSSLRKYLNVRQPEPTRIPVPTLALRTPSRT